MTRTAELAEPLDVRLHTHLAETQDEDAFCLETFGRRPVDYLADVGWMTDRTWLAHVVWPAPDEVARLGAARVGAAHCPSSNMILGSGLAPVAELRAAGAPVGLGVDGSASADSASLWLEARTAMLQGKLRHGAGGDVRTGRPGDRHPRRGGVPGPGRGDRRAVGRRVRRPGGLAARRACASPVRCRTRWRPGCAAGRCRARHTVVGGRLVVEDGVAVHPGLDEQLAVHRRVSQRLQAALD